MAHDTVLTPRASDQPPEQVRWETPAGTTTAAVPGAGDDVLHLRGVHEP